jgi:hypothetical protein
MTANVGTTDRIVRAVLGVLALIAALLTSNIIFGVIGVVMLFTASVRWCALYAPFGISTCAVEPNKH